MRLNVRFVFQGRLIRPLLLCNNPSQFQRACLHRRWPIHEAYSTLVTPCPRGAGTDRVGSPGVCCPVAPSYAFDSPLSLAADGLLS